MADNTPRFCEQTEAGKRPHIEPLMEQLTRRPHRSPPANVPNTLARLFPPHMADRRGAEIAGLVTHPPPPLPSPTSAAAVLGRHAVMNGSTGHRSSVRQPVNAMQFVAEAGMLEQPYERMNVSNVERHLLTGGGRGDDSILSALFGNGVRPPTAHKPHFARHPRMDEDTATKNLIGLLIGSDGMTDREYVPREKSLSTVDVGVIGGEQRARANTIGKKGSKERVLSDSDSTGAQPPLIAGLSAKVCKDGDDDTASAKVTTTAPPFPAGWYMETLRGGGVLLRRDVQGHADLRVTYPRESIMALSRSTLTAICPDEWAVRQANLVELIPEYVHRFDARAHEMLGTQISVTNQLSVSSHRYYFDRPHGAPTGAPRREQGGRMPFYEQHHGHGPHVY